MPSAVILVITFAGFANGSLMGCTALSYLWPAVHGPPWAPLQDTAVVMTVDPACWQKADAAAKEGFKP